MQAASQVQKAEQSGLWFVFIQHLIIKFPFFSLFCLCFVFFTLEKGRREGMRNKTREKCQKTFSTISKNREPQFLSRQYEFWVNYFFQFSIPIKISAKATTIRTLIFQMNRLLPLCLHLLLFLRRYRVASVLVSTKCRESSFGACSVGDEASSQTSKS